MRFGISERKEAISSDMPRQGKGARRGVRQMRWLVALKRLFSYEVDSFAVVFSTETGRIVQKEADFSRESIILVDRSFRYLQFFRDFRLHLFRLP